MMLRRPSSSAIFTLSCVSLSFLILSAPGFAQRGHGGSMPTGNKTYTIPVTVRRVVLDVVVTDSSGNAATGLTQKDFSVFEDGKPENIKSFEPFNFEPAKEYVAPKPPQLPPDTFMNVATTQERGPLYVIVYDAVHMRHNDIEDDQIIARKQLAQFMASKPAGTRFALFLLAEDFHLVQGFTTDPQKLLQAFDTHKKGGIPLYFLYGSNYGASDLDLPYEVMAFLGHYLEGLPGRKNLIWMSSEFPATVPMFAVQNTIATAQRHGGFDGGIRRSHAGAGIRRQRADHHGRHLEREGDAQGHRRAERGAGFGVSHRCGRSAAGAERHRHQCRSHCRATGGHAYYNTNDFSGAMQQATKNGSSYYEMSYCADERRDGPEDAED